MLFEILIGLVIFMTAFMLGHKVRNIDCVIFKDISKLVLNCLLEMYTMAHFLHRFSRKIEDELGGVAVMVNPSDGSMTSVEERAWMTMDWARITFDNLQPLLEGYVELSNDEKFLREFTTLSVKISALMRMVDGQ